MKHDAEGILKAAGFGAITSFDPVMIALEAAIHTISDNHDSPVMAIPYRAAQCLPPLSTDFERGMAFGMAVILMANAGANQCPGK